MTEQKLPKIAIVGAHCERAAIETLIRAIVKDKLEAIIIDIDSKKCDGFIPPNKPLPIEPLQMLEMPFTPPETRAERRAKARKKSRK